MATVPKKQGESPSGAESTQPKAKQKAFERRIVLHNVRWKTYEALVRDLEHSPVRLTYDQGSLELVSPANVHDWGKKLIGRMVEAMTEELDIPIRSGGSTTFRRALLKKGLEPDECYWVQNEPLVRGKRNIDLDTDPPPDLAIEVENTRSIVGKLGVYAALGFPEVWRYNGRTIRVARLQPHQTYRWLGKSPAFPFLPLSELVRFLGLSETMDETTWIRTFRAWVRDELTARYREVNDGGQHT